MLLVSLRKRRQHVRAFFAMHGEDPFQIICRFRHVCDGDIPENIPLEVDNTSLPSHLHTCNLCIAVVLRVTEEWTLKRYLDTAPLEVMDEANEGRN